MRLLPAWVSIAALLCPLAWAQVRVAGQVTNENDLPVAGARITAEDIPPTRSWEAISDPTGTFLLQLPAAGQYSLKVDREGFYVVSEPAVTVPANRAETPPVEVHISLESIHEIRSTSGEGQTVPAGVDGAVVGSSGSGPALSVSVRVGGIPAVIEYAGGAPGGVSGVMQINVQIPAGVRPGGYVPVVVQVGSASSKPDAIWIAVSGE